MDEFVAVLLLMGVSAAVIFLAALLATLLGAFAGWVVGLVFGETILSIFASLGLTGYKMWQIGAFLGFTGSFFKSYINVKKT